MDATETAEQTELPEQDRMTNAFVEVVVELDDFTTAEASLFAMDGYDAETRLREVLAWARGGVVELNTRNDSVSARALAMIATDVENALRRLILPTP